MKLLSAFVRLNGRTTSIQMEPGTDQKIERAKFDTDPLYLTDVEIPHWEGVKRMAEWHIARAKFLFAKCIDTKLH